jgi:hypothetical protein
MVPVTVKSTSASSMEAAGPESLALSRSRICAGRSEREEYDRHPNYLRSHEKSSKGAIVLAERNHVPLNV